MFDRSAHIFRGVREHGAVHFLPAVRNSHLIMIGAQVILREPDPWIDCDYRHS